MYFIAALEYPEASFVEAGCGDENAIPYATKYLATSSVEASFKEAGGGVFY
jgi:hypothetical protein